MRYREERAARGRNDHSVRHLRRWPLGTAFTKVTDDIVDLAYRPERKWPCIAADTTDVGTAVMEMIGQALRTKAGDDRQADQCPVLITGGARRHARS
jgi:hypothetical protein